MNSVPHYPHNQPDGPQGGQRPSDRQNFGSPPPPSEVPASTGGKGRTPSPVDGDRGPGRGPQTTSPRHVGWQWKEPGPLSGAGVMRSINEGWLDQRHMRGPAVEREYQHPQESELPVTSANSAKAGAM